MKKTVLFLTLLSALTHLVSAQCNLSVTLTSVGGPCLGHDTLTVNGAALATQIVWEVGGVPIDTVYSQPDSAGITVAGDPGGAFGLTAALLNTPFGVAVDASGNVYVSDKSNNRIQRWAPGATTGETIAGDAGGNSGDSANLLNGPAGIFLDAAGNLYIVDEYNNRVQKWAAGASSGVTVAGDSGGASGVTAALLDQPLGIYVDNSGNMFITDHNNNRVQKWVPGATSGTTVAGDPAGSSSRAGNRLNTPAGIWGDAAGNLYIADAYNNRVQKWAPGAATGVTIAGDSAGRYGYFDYLLWYPFGVFVDPAGVLYVADASNNRIQKWLPGATSGTTVAGDSLGGIGVTPSKFNFTTSVIVAGAEIFATDLGNNRVQKWGPNIATTHIPATAGSYTAVVTSYTGCTDTTNAIIVDSFSTPAVSITASSSGPICGYTIDTFTSSIANGGTTPTYQWYRNGVPVSTAPSYADSGFSNNDSVWVVMTSSAPCLNTPSATSNKISLNIQAALVAAVTIHATATAVCTATIDTFTATTLNSGTTPSYQWYKDGALVSTSPEYIAGGLQNGDSVWVVMTSNAPCVLAPTVSSNSIHLSVALSVTPTVSIQASATSICNTMPDTFTAYVSNGGTPAYQWYKDGMAVSTNPSYIASGFNNDDSVWVVVTGNALCTGGNPDASSQVIHLYVGTTSPPVISIRASVGDTICVNTIDTFYATSANGGSQPSYEWKRNGVPVSNAQDLICTPVNGDVITCVLTSSFTCSGQSTATSNTLTLAVNPEPIVSVELSSADLACPGDSVMLSVSGGSSYLWSSGATSAVIYAHSSGTFNVTATSAFGCSAGSSPVTVNFATVTPPTISQTGDTLISSPEPYYQWYLNGNIINNATHQDLPIAVSGQYEVNIIDANGCKSNSSLFPVTGVGILDITGGGFSVKLYPNPNAGIFTLEFGDGTERLVTITDALGREILSDEKVTHTHQFDLSAFSDGIYYMLITGGSGSETVKFSVVR